MSKHILIISYVFPPYPGIGGRRWAKFAKYLSRKGYTVHVICSKNPFDEVSQWTSDTLNNNNIKVHYLAPKYPLILLKQPKTVLDKISYRLNEKVLKLLAKGTIYERALFWKQDLLKTAEQLIKKHQIKNVIASGAPFYILYYASLLKKNHPEINLILDYRDQWTDNLSFMGYHTLPQKRLDYEKQIELKALSSADIIMSVADTMTDNLKKRASNDHARFLTLNNGFDPDDIISTKTVSRAKEKIRFVLMGNFYNNVEYIFKPLLESLQQIKTENPGLYKRLSFEFYGTAPASSKQLVKENDLDVITFFNSIPLTEAYQKMQSADACMLFLNEDLTFSMSTKFFEYLAMRKPIVVFSHLGDLSAYVTQHKIGYAITPERCKDDLLEMLNDFNNEKVAFNESFDVEQFSVNGLTDKLIGMFK